jgi:hypothetical protein
MFVNRAPATVIYELGNPLRTFYFVVVLAGRTDQAILDDILGVVQGAAFFALGPQTIGDLPLLVLWADGRIL